MNKDFWQTTALIMGAVLGTLTFMAGGFVIALVLGGIFAGAYLHRRLAFKKFDPEENNHG